VRIVIQGPLDAAAYLIPASCMAVPAEAPLGRAQVPLASVRGPVGVGVRRGAANRSFWLFALGRSASPGSSVGALSPCFLLASPVTLATTAPSSLADPATPVVSTVTRVGTANRLPLALPVPDSLLFNTSATRRSEGNA